MPELVAEYVRLIDSLRGNPWSAPVFVLLYASACFLAPLSLFPVAGGVLFGFWVGMAFNLLASMMGASGAFFLARGLGRERVTRWLSRWEHHGKFLQAMENPAPGAFILLRLLGFPPFVITNYLAGLSQMPWARFLWTSVVGLLPWTFIMTYFANAFWAALKKAGLSGFQAALKEFSLPLLGAVLGLIALGLGTLYAQGKWGDKKTRKT